MGMAASQARLLSITSRMNDVEFKSQSISNTKIRLADESEQVANAYTKALNKQKLTMTNYATGQAVVTNVTVNSLCQPGSPFKLKTRSEKIVVPSNVKKNFDNSAKLWNHYTTQSNPSGEHNIKMKNDANARFREVGYVFTLNQKFGVGSWKEAYKNNGLPENSTGGYQPLINAGKITQAEIDFYTEMFTTLFEATPQNSGGTVNVNQSGAVSLDPSCLNDPSWLYEAIESGEFMLVDASGKEVSVSSNTQLAIQTDSTNLAKAEAEYNAATAKINKKEKLLDNDLKALDTEHQALKTEQDSIKSLIKDNIDKSFQLFS